MSLQGNQIKRNIISRPIINKNAMNGSNNNISNGGQNIIPANQQPVRPIIKPRTVQASGCQEQTPATNPNLAGSQPIGRKPASTSTRLRSRIAPREKAKDVQQADSPGPRKKFNKNIIFLIAGAVIIILVVFGLMSHSAAVRKAGEQDDLQIKYVNEAKSLYDSKDYDGALKKFQKFLVDFRGSKYSAQVKENIALIESITAKEKEAKEKLAKLVQKKKNAETSLYPEIADEFKNFIREYQDTKYVDQAKGELESMQRIVASVIKDRESNLVNQTLLDAESMRKKGEYDKAINLLQDFLKQHRNLNDREENRLKNDLEKINKEKEQKSSK